MNHVDEFAVGEVRAYFTERNQTRIITLGHEYVFSLVFAPGLQILLFRFHFDFKACSRRVLYERINLGEEDMPDLLRAVPFDDMPSCKKIQALIASIDDLDYLREAACLSNNFRKHAIDDGFLFGDFI